MIPVGPHGPNRPVRWVAHRPFPNLTYIPGQPAPHPTRSHAAAEETSATQGQPPDEEAAGPCSPVAALLHPDALPDAWATLEHYQWAVDLWNWGFYWEAHEQWELLWKEVPRQSWQSTLLSGLIKLAASGVKVREGRLNGVRRHLSRTVLLLGQAAERYRDTSAPSSAPPPEESSDGYAYELTSPKLMGLELGPLSTEVQRCLEASFLAVRSSDPFPEVAEPLPATLGLNEPWPVFPFSLHLLAS